MTTTTHASLERDARVALSRIAEPGDPYITQLLALEGARDALEKVRENPRFQPRLRSLDVARDLAAAEKVGARFITPMDDEWPTGLSRLATPPVGLWVRGTLPQGKSIAVVGTRMATAYGETVASEWSQVFVTEGVPVISGAAFGIDAAAHRGALVAGGRTVAVLAGGVDRPYPTAHARLLDAILDKDGAIVSEVAPGSAPMRSRFLARNRVIAALSRVVLIPEAAARSGSMNTAGHAEKLGVPVLGVPGPVTYGGNDGVHELIRDGRARLVFKPGQVLDTLYA